jgi:hypothetical protein
LIIRGNSQKANLDRFMKGWVVGHMHGDEVNGTPEIEVKLWHYEGPIDYGKKQFGGTELVVVYGGRLTFNTETVVDGKVTAETFTVGSKDEHEYIIFPPGTTKEVVVENAPAFGVTVRWPSGPGVNQVLVK